MITLNIYSHWLVDKYMVIKVTIIKLLDTKCKLFWLLSLLKPIKLIKLTHSHFGCIYAYKVAYKVHWSVDNIYCSITNYYGIDSSCTSINDFSERHVCCVQECPINNSIVTACTHRPSNHENCV